MRTFKSPELKEAFYQGARCGHGDGTYRVGTYVLGEEFDLAFEAEENGNVYSNLGEDYSDMWRKGYMTGYRLGASGELLPVQYQYPVERKPSTWA